jgi:hypothetical protein
MGLKKPRRSGTDHTCWIWRYSVTFAHQPWAIKAIPGIVGISFSAAEEETRNSG